MLVRFMQRLFKCLRISPNRDGLSDSLSKSAVNDVADHNKAYGDLERAKRDTNTATGRGVVFLA